MLHFTCGEKKSLLDIKKCQNIVVMIVAKKVVCFLLLLVMSRK